MLYEITYNHSNEDISFSRVVEAPQPRRTDLDVAVPDKLIEHARYVAHGYVAGSPSDYVEVEIASFRPSRVGFDKNNTCGISTLLSTFRVNGAGEISTAVAR